MNTRPPANTRQPAGTRPLLSVRDLVVAYGEIGRAHV